MFLDLVRLPVNSFESLTNMGLVRNTTDVSVYCGTDIGYSLQLGLRRLIQYGPKDWVSLTLFIYT